MHIEKTPYKPLVNHSNSWGCGLVSSAKEMLKSGMFTIKEISEELGYCDVSHFSKTFSRTCGVTPGKYRGK